MADAAPCSDVSRAHLEPLVGTGSRVRNWLLVEHPADWGRDALSESGLSERVAQELKLRAGRAHVRVLLTRRPGDEQGTTLDCYAAHSSLERQWLHHLPLSDVSELLEVDLEQVRAGERPGVGVVHDKPLFLVCTHGRHDPCCGRRGPSIAESLAASRGEATWECSHVGGDRFAANLVCLPYGLFFGRVENDSATEIATLYEHGLIALDHYRGRSCFEPVVQAADIFLRRAIGLPGIDDLVPTWRRDHGGGESTMCFRTVAGEQLAVRVAVRRAAKRRITCAATHPGAPREFAVVSGPTPSDD